MRAHIHFDRGLPQSVNNYLALDGFQQMGWEIVPYTDAEPIRDHAPDEVVVGHIAAVRASLRALGLAVPAELSRRAAPVSGASAVGKHHQRGGCRCQPVAGIREAYSRGQEIYGGAGAQFARPGGLRRPV